MSGPKARSLAERFWPKVRKGDPNECWLWTAGINNTGYGRINVGGRVLLAHRAAWLLTNGSLAADKDVLHRCDTPRCVNPAHLFLGTHAENMADMAAKLRAGQRRLTPEQVAMIRSFYASGAWTQTALAAKFGVRQCHISDICRRKFWRHAA